MCFPGFASALRPHQVEQRAKAGESPGALAAGKMSAGSTRSAGALAQNQFQLRKHLLPQEPQAFCRHRHQLLKGKNAPLEHPLPEPPGLPRRGFPRKTGHELAVASCQPAWQQKSP